MRLQEQICIGVVAKNNEKDLRYLVESIPPGFTCIMVDGGSTDRTREVAEAAGWKVILREDEKYGYNLVECRNAIIHESVATGKDFVLFLDTDELFPEHSEEIEQFLVGPCEVGMIPHLNHYYNQAVRSFGTKNYHPRLLKNDKPYLVGTLLEGIICDAKVHQFRRTYIPHYPNSTGYQGRALRELRVAQEIARNILSGSAVNRRAYVNRVRSLCGFATPLIRFMYYYLVRGGIFEGKAGLAVAVNSAITEYWIQLHLLEQRRIEQKQRL